MTLNCDSGKSQARQLLNRFVAILAVAPDLLNNSDAAAIEWQRVRRMHPRLPIVFADGYAETSALDSIAESSIMLCKPFGVSELQDAARTALRR